MSKKKEKNDVYNVGRNVTKSRRGKICANVAERRSTRALRSKKNNTVKKNHPRVGRGIKNAAKAMKEPVLITVFSLVNRVSKKRD